VARLTYDILLDLHEFLEMVDSLGRNGATVRQFAKLPRANLNFDDPRVDVRIQRYRAFGLRLGVDLPHPHEVANLVALTVDARTRRCIDWTWRRQSQTAAERYAH
jgi:hypothetical protein